MVDVSGSMMRFNSEDGRLERMLSATLMILEALPRKTMAATSKELSESSTSSSELSEVDLIEYSIAGHSVDN